MVTDLSRLPSPSCPAARALRLRDRLAARRGPAWTIAAALVMRLATVKPSAGPSVEKLRPGSLRPVVSPSISLRAAPRPEPPWQEEGEEEAKALAAALPQFAGMADTFRFSDLRPPARVGGRALPSVCLTPRLLPIPAARVA